MKSIFVSYTNESTRKGLITKLKEMLHRFDYEVFDPKQFTFPGEAPDTESLLSLLQNLIKKSDVVVAFLYGDEQQHVFFDLGYAIGIGKEVLVVSPTNSSLPRYLSGINSIKFDIYDWDVSYEIFTYLQRMDISEMPKQKREDDFRDKLLKYKDDPPSFDLIDPLTFQELVFEWLESKGYEPKFNKDVYDGGVDIILYNYKDYAKTLVQVKKYNKNNKITVGEVRNLLGTAFSLKADCSILLTTSDFTRSAKDFAENVELNIELWSMDDVIKQI